jgi:hypothetical protein
LLKRFAVLLSWLLLSSDMMEEMSSGVGAAATSDDSRLPMNGIVDEMTYELQLYDRLLTRWGSRTTGEAITAIAAIFCSKPHTEGVERTKNVGDILNATDVFEGIPESPETVADHYTVRRRGKTNMLARLVKSIYACVISVAQRGGCHSHYCALAIHVSLDCWGRCGAHDLWNAWRPVYGMQNVRKRTLENLLKPLCDDLKAIVCD